MINVAKACVGVPIGQSACRFLALAREAIDSTRAGTSGDCYITLLLDPKSKEAMKGEGNLHL